MLGVAAGLAARASADGQDAADEEENDDDAEGDEDDPEG